MIAKDFPLNTLETVRLPLDLSDWTGRHQLACLALEASTETAEQAFAGLFAADQEQLTRAKTLLALLTYCYAAGVFASDDIELRAIEDPMIRYLAGHTPPEWSRLRAFRRQWHAAVHNSLVRLFQLAWSRYRTEPEEGFALPPTHAPCCAAESAWARGFAVEAERRINRAVLLDSMFADE